MFLYFLLKKGNDSEPSSFAISGHCWKHPVLPHRRLFVARFGDRARKGKRSRTEEREGVYLVQICRKICGLGCVNRARVRVQVTQPSPCIYLPICIEWRWERPNSRLERTKPRLSVRCPSMSKELSEEGGEIGEICNCLKLGPSDVVARTEEGGRFSNLPGAMDSRRAKSTGLLHSFP